MSEPIQAISQGNYILATQQEVSHDASLSGNGTVESPLSVVPGYNETVLWSGTGNSGTNITLSEPLENFEKVGILWEPFAALGRDTGFEITPTYNDNVVNSYKKYAMFQQTVSTAHNSYLNCSLTVSSNGTSFGQYLYGYTNGNPANFWTDHADWTIYKIIGINRIANN